MAQPKKLTPLRVVVGVLAAFLGGAIGFVVLAPLASFSASFPALGCLAGITGAVVLVFGRPTGIGAAPAPIARDDERAAPTPEVQGADEAESEHEESPPSPRDVAAERDERDERAERLLRIREELASPTRESGNPVFLILTALFAVQLLRSEASLERIAILGAVLAFHELGHFVGMKVFGYRDVRVFFIPWFGAATTGLSDGAARWKQGVVLLLGPMPGLAIGAALFAARPLPHDLAHLAVQLVFLNALNLLPLGALDGGKLIHLVAFSRSRRFEAAFLVTANVALALLAWALKAPLLGVVAAIGVFTASRRVEVGRAADGIRARHGALPPIAELGDDALGDVVDTARASIPAGQPVSRDVLMREVRSLYELARGEPLAPRAAAALVAVYLLGVGLAANAAWTLRAP